VSATDQARVVKLALLDARIEQARVARAARRITHEQVLAYYARHQRRFLVGEHRNVALVETSGRGPVMKLKREIEAGHDVRSVALRVSRGSGAFAKGSVRELARPAAVSGAGLVANIFRARPHLLVGPLRGDWFYVFEVLRVTPAHELPLTRARRTIVEELAASQAVTVLRAADERKWAARTTCARGYAASECGHRGAGVA
jgi:hypothetical protein